MGSYTELIIDNYPVLHSKSYVVPEAMIIFCESDKKIFRRKLSERNQLVWGNISSEDDSDEIAYEYRIEVGKAIDRLEIIGYTFDKAKREFKSSIKDEIESARNTDFLEEEFNLLISSTLDDFFNAFQELKSNKLCSGDFAHEQDLKISKLASYLLNTDGWRLNFPSNDIRCYIRLLLETFPKDALVTQDITEVTDAGYYEPADEVRNIAIESLTEGIEINSKIIILTEGTSDRDIIERSMNILFPHLRDYYSFVDFGLSNLSGGASSLVAQIKGFVGAGIKNRVIALLDNDTAAYVAEKGLGKTLIPPSIKILHYPHLPLAENYPTLGPTGCQSVDVNGLAGSIELYLGKDILEKDGVLTPVVWKGFDSSLKKYQGEVIDKTEIQRLFYSKLECCEKDNSLIINYDWIGIKLILNEIFCAFKTR